MHKTLSKVMHELCKLVQSSRKRRFRRSLPCNRLKSNRHQHKNSCGGFALIHDGWTRGAKYYLGIYASFMNTDMNDTKLRLVSVTRMMEDDIVNVGTTNFESILEV